MVPPFPICVKHSGIKCHNQELFFLENDKNMYVICDKFFTDGVLCSLYSNCHIIYFQSVIIIKVFWSSIFVVLNLV